MPERRGGTSTPQRVLIMAPNWLGDAIMALPAIADVRRAFPSARMTVAARRSVVELFSMVRGVDATVAPEHIGTSECETAILLPNSFASAWVVWRAGIPERWGYRGDVRGPLLTRSVPRPAGSMHQGAYYQHLVRELGFDSGPLEPELSVPEAAIASARGCVSQAGWDGSRPLVVFAPGAAYGTAKRWMPAHVARAATQLIHQRRATCVLVGSAGDRSTAIQIMTAADDDAGPHIIDLTGQTTLPQLAGLLQMSGACVANDSGAMHLAAAIGTPLVAPFGPTNEFETAPLTRAGREARVLTHPVWCRPCMLRECPIDHRCMRGITPERVVAALDAML